MAMVTLRSIERIVNRARWLMGAAVAVQIVFLVTMVAAGIVSPIGVQVGQMDMGTLVLISTCVSWFLLLMRSLGQGQYLRQASLLIGEGRALQAVPFLAIVLEQFSVFRLPKLIALQHLMELSHKQKDAPVTAKLAGEILRYGLAWRKGLAGRACLVLAESLMEMGEGEAAGRVLAQLHGRRLTVSQRLQLLPILLRWQMMNGKYVESVQDLEEKVHLAALLNCEQACLVHVLLAAATKRRNLEAESRFLLRRAGLHYNLQALAQRNPSAKRYLVELLSLPQDDSASASGRTAYVPAAEPAVLQDVQPVGGAAEPAS